MVVTIETLNPEIRNALDHFENLWRSREEYFEWCELIDPICFNKYRAMRGATISADKNLYENIVLSNDTIQKSHEYIRQFKVPNIDNLVPFARLCGCLKTYQDKFFYVDNDTLDVYYWTNMFSSTDDVYNRKPDTFERICTLNEFGTRINELLTLYNDQSMMIFVDDGDIPKDLPIIIGWNEDTPLYPKQLNTYPSDIGGGKRIVYAPPGVLKTIISEYNSNEYDEGLTWALGNTHSTKIFKAICDITGQDYSDLIHEFQADKYDHLLFPVIYKICNGNILLNIYSTNVLLIFDIGPTRLFVMLSGNYSYDKCTIWIAKDGKTQIISESYIPDDATSGTSDFDEKDDDPDDCYCEHSEIKTYEDFKKGKMSVNKSYEPLSEFDHYFQESKMSSKTRNNLDDSDFALVYTESTGKKIRKYPINDEAHVKAAARMFPRGVPNKYRKEVAGKILRRAHKFGIDTSGWKSLNESNNKD